MLERNGGLRQKDEPERMDLGKAPAHKYAMAPAIRVVDADDARTHRRQKRLVVGQNLKVALLARNDDRLRRPAVQHLVGRDEFKGKCGHGLSLGLRAHQAASAASFLAFSTACSIVPTM